MDIMHYIELGGVIMYILIALNIIGFTIMIFKFLQFLFIDKDKLALKIVENLEMKDLTVAKESILQKMLHFEWGLSTVKTIASIAPLLGLLGTAIGVLSAFEAISKQGLGDPTIFAGGISLALITTVGGLIVAIPHYIGYNYLITKLDHLEATLNQKITLQILKSSL